MINGQGSPTLYQVSTADLDGEATVAIKQEGKSFNTEPYNIGPCITEKITD